MLDKRILARINDRPRGRGTAVYAALGVVLAAVMVGLLVSYPLATVVLVAGGALTYLLRKRDVEARTVKLRYDLDGEAATAFERVRESCKALSGAEKVWRIEGDVEGTGGYTDGTVLSFDGRTSRSPVEVGVLTAPGISTNVEIWGIKTDESSLYFLPECVLSYSDDRYRPIAYDTMGVVYRPSRTAEEGEAPEDAETAGETWRYVRPDGTPDNRYPQNRRYDLVLYGLLSVTGTEPGMHLLVSNKAAAMRFARAFDAGRARDSRGGVRQGADYSLREERALRHAAAEAEKNGSLLKVLGVAPGASRKEIDAAYKKQAKTYHPDRVASLAPEVREMAELRMKEINASYDELKRKAH